MATNKTVFFLIGILLIVLGTSMLAPYMLQVIFKEGSHSFISASFVTIFIGVLFILANLEREFKLNLRQTFLFSSLAWVMVATFGSLPFLLSSQDFSLSIAEQTNIIINILKYAGVIINDPTIIDVASQEVAQVEANEKS